MSSDGPGDWNRIELWRVEQRKLLLEQRKRIVLNERRRIEARVIRGLFDWLSGHSISRLGFYWPIKGELNLRLLIDRLAIRKVEFALPVVTERNRPLEYWSWSPGDDMTRGFWNIPVPARQKKVLPDAVIAPLVGYDRQNYRLGYGGGYFDRTLAALWPRPLVIGVGLDTSGLETIHPQPHDIPMDVVVTERGTNRSPWLDENPPMSEDATG